jgi:hypothetical protein
MLYFTQWSASQETHPTQMKRIKLVLLEWVTFSMNGAGLNDYASGKVFGPLTQPETIINVR